MATAFTKRAIPPEQMSVPDTSVVVAYPTRGDVRIEFHRSFMQALLADKAWGHNLITFERAGISNVNICKARNELTREFLDDYDAEWLWFLDDDMVIKPETLPTLLATAQAVGAKVIGGLCVAVGPDGPIPTIYQLGNPAAGELTRMMLDYEDGVVTTVAASGAACLLIHRDVLEAFRAAEPSATYPWWAEREVRGNWVGEDVLFTLRCNELGFPVFVHQGVHVGHAKPGRVWWPADVKAGVGFPEPKDYVVIPTRDRFDLLRPLVEQLAEQGGVEVIVADNGMPAGALGWLDASDDVTVLDCLGQGIHEMWNAGIDHIEAKGQRRNVNVVFLNDDVKLGPAFVARLTEALRSEPNLVAVSGNYDGRDGDGLVQYVTDICAGRYDGTGGLAGFAFAVRGEWFLSGYRFPTECKWWYGDNDLVNAVVNCTNGVGRVAIALDAHVEHIDGGGQTGGDWSAMAGQLEADRQAYEERWRKVAQAQAAPTESLADAYRRMCGTPSDINEHLPTLVELVRRTGAKAVIELGTRGGVSTIAWLHALGETGGHLWTVDLAPAPFRHERMTHTVGSDLDPFVQQHLPDRADIVFVDTDHTYEQTAAEVAAYAGRVRPGGCMVFHDTAVEAFDHHDTPQPPYPVRRAVDEWAGPAGYRVERWEGNNGLTVVWLPEAAA